MPTSPLVAATIWMALVLYAAGEYGRVRRPPARWARPLWLLGLVAYLAHVAAAFAIHHDWSHEVASTHTAARTAALTGVTWGGGLWVNYAFSVVWVVEAVRWSVWPGPAATRPRGATRVVRAVFLFMIVNGAVVFVDGPRRWLGAAIIAALVWIWWRAPAAEGGYAGSDTRRL